MVEIAGVAPVGRPVGERERPARAERLERVEGGAPAGALPKFRGVRAVAPISPTTAVYDRAGRYPALFLFQIARPKPPPPPFGDLFLAREDAASAASSSLPRRGGEGLERFEAPPAVRSGLVGRFAPRGPSAGMLLDFRV